MSQKSNVYKANPLFLKIAEYKHSTLIYSRTLGLSNSLRSFQPHEDGGKRAKEKPRKMRGLFFLDILGCGAGNRTRSGRL